MLRLVLGGARSGKSRYAVSHVVERQQTQPSLNVTFVATAAAGDDAEMQDRVRRHREERPRTWATIEEPLRVVEAIESLQSTTLATRKIVVVDCVTVWLSNLSFALKDRASADRVAAALEEVGRLAALSARTDLVLVSNEIGGGVVPVSSVAREFRDLQGLANQRLARAADHVALVVAGISVALK